MVYMPYYFDVYYCLFSCGLFFRMCFRVHFFFFMAFCMGVAVFFFRVLCGFFRIFFCAQFFSLSNYLFAFCFIFLASSANSVSPTCESDSFTICSFTVSFFSSTFSFGINCSNSCISPACVIARFICCVSMLTVFPRTLFLFMAPFVFGLYPTPFFSRTFFLDAPCIEGFMGKPCLSLPPVIFALNPGNPIVSRLTSSPIFLFRKTLSSVFLFALFPLFGSEITMFMQSPLFVFQFF